MFDITNESTVFTFDAGKSEDRDYWIKAINEVCFIVGSTLLYYWAKFIVN